MNLGELLKGMEYELLQGSLEQDIKDVVYDSRKAGMGCIFVCINGETLDAHKFIPEVVSKGVKVVVVEKEIVAGADITLIKVASSRIALAFMAAAYFGNPAEKLVTIGLTGTKGKTTTSYMIQAILEAAGKKVGVIGTIGAVIDKVKVKTANTTPESYELQKLLKQMVETGCDYCVMEVSSQGLKMDRTAGFIFDYGVFTNFSPDHIGPKEHESMEEYLYCKSLLFNQCKVGIINIDDDNYTGVTKGHTCSLQTFGFGERADLRADNMRLISAPGRLGIGFNVSGIMNMEVETEIPGRFSVYNSLVALLICKNLGIEERFMLKALKGIKVPGRVEIVDVPGDFTIMIDYAHNAVSVESLLTTIKEYEPKRIVCVYGGGGNRSKLRRYDMGELCGKMADLSILTCDNPRDEEVEIINEDIKIGLARNNGKFIEIPDRKEAILYTMDHAQKGDIIILLGKGHEDYQEIKGKKYHFSEREIIREYASDIGSLRAAEI